MIAPKSTRTPDGVLEVLPHHRQLALRLHEAREDYEMVCLTNRLLLAQLGFPLPSFRRLR